MGARTISGWSPWRRQFSHQAQDSRLTPTAGGQPIDPGVPLRRDGSHQGICGSLRLHRFGCAGYITGETIVIDSGKR